MWSADIEYIPVQRGFPYLVAVMDWATRRVLSWRLSNTLDARFCTEALSEGLERYGRPEIFNSDQGSQFISLEFTSVLKRLRCRHLHGRQGPVPGQRLHCAPVAFPQVRGRLPARALGRLPAQRVISRWMEFYNTQRPHSALAGSTPQETYERRLQRTAPQTSPAPLPVPPEQEDLLNGTLAA